MAVSSKIKIKKRGGQGAELVLRRHLHVARRENMDWRHVDHFFLSGPTVNRFQHVNLEIEYHSTLNGKNR